VTDDEIVIDSAFGGPPGTGSGGCGVLSQVRPEPGLCTRLRLRA
jgi:hypothetical protein